VRYLDALADEKLGGAGHHVRVSAGQLESEGQERGVERGGEGKREGEKVKTMLADKKGREGKGREGDGWREGGRRGRHLDPKDVLAGVSAEEGRLTLLPSE